MKINLNNFVLLLKLKLMRYIQEGIKHELLHITQTTTKKFRIINFDSTVLQKVLFNSAVLSSCKSKRDKLGLWQNKSKKQGLKETLYSKCTYCTIVEQ